MIDPQPPGTPDADVIRRVADDLSIRRTLARSAQAEDDRDRDTFEACFAERVMLTEAAAVDNWTPHEITRRELTDMIFASIEQAEFSHHLITNELIAVEGDRATCHADLLAIAQRREGDALTTTLAGGRYTMKLVRESDDEWRISERGLRVRYRLTV